MGKEKDYQKFIDRLRKDFNDSIKNFEQTYQENKRQLRESKI